MIHFTWVTGFGTTMICCVRRQGKVSSSRYTKPELSNQKKNMGGGAGVYLFHGMKIGIWGENIFLHYFFLHFFLWILL